MDIQNPRQIILVSCRNVGKDNVLTLSWHTPLSFRPELYGLVMSKKRFSYGMIKESGCFVVNFMPLDMKNEVLYCGTHSGKKVDKFKELVLGKEEAEKIDCPVIKECVAYLECKLVDEIKAGDHVILIGNVLKKKVKSNKKRIFQEAGAGYKFTTTE